MVHDSYLSVSECHRPYRISGKDKENKWLRTGLLLDT